MAKLNLERRTVQEVDKLVDFHTVRLSQPEKAALAHVAEREEANESDIVRYALALLPGWKSLVRRFRAEMR